MKPKSLTIDQEPSMTMAHNKMATCLLLVIGALLGIVTTVCAHGKHDDHGSFLDALEDTPALSVSTVPLTGTQAGDQNPYGVTVVPVDSGMLKQGDILVSDFNDVTNLQGTGSSIVRIDPVTQMQTLFFDAQSPIGLTTALVALRSGFVVVGSAMRVDNPPAPSTVNNASLIFLDGFGNVALVLTDSALLNGPWDMTVNDKDPNAPLLFVSDVLSGTVVRIAVRVNKGAISIESITKIGSGFAFRTDMAALVIGPTGLALDPQNDELFVADTGANRIAELDHASTATSDQGSGDTVFAGPPLEGPLGLVLTQGHLIAVNGDSVSNNTPNMAVEIKTNGKLVATKTLDTSGTSGALFGITLTDFENELSLVFVDDNDNTVKILKTH